MKISVEKINIFKTLSYVQSIVEKKNTIPVLSNVLIQAKENKKKDHKEMGKNILKFVQSMFSPELLNRIDEMIVFNSLTENHIYNIIDLKLNDLIKNLRGLGIKIIVYKSAKYFILKTGYNVKYGVRFLRRTIQTSI